MLCNVFLMTRINILDAASSDAIRIHGLSYTMEQFFEMVLPLLKIFMALLLNIYLTE